MVADYHLGCLLPDLADKLGLLHPFELFLLVEDRRETVGRLLRIAKQGQHILLLGSPVVDLDSTATDGCKGGRAGTATAVAATEHGCSRR